MTIPELREKANQQTVLSEQLYHNHWGHLFYALAIVAPYTLWGFGYVFTEIRDAILVSVMVSVVYEIYCLRCDVQYYGEIWRRDLKIGSPS